MCKYCQEEFIYHDDSLNYFLLEDCEQCGMPIFNRIEDGECCDEVESYSMTKYYTACAEEYGLELMCHCGDSDYILVNVKEYIEGAGRIVEDKAWLHVGDMQLDLETDFSECPQCGNEKDLYYEVNKEEESAELSIICPKCHCIDKYELD